MRRSFYFFVMVFLAHLLGVGCLPARTESTPAPLPSATLPAVYFPSPVATLPPPQVSTVTPVPLVPNFAHIVMIVLENKEFDAVIGNRDAPYFNLFAESYALLTQHYAVSSDSLHNYFALVSGAVFNIPDDCLPAECAVRAETLPDLIEASGRTWKAYQDDMPEPCFEGETLRYRRNHNPFIFFDSIRSNEVRCRGNVVPLLQLDGDLALRDLPDFMFIAPMYATPPAIAHLILPMAGYMRPLIKFSRFLLLPANRTL